MPGLAAVVLAALFLEHDDLGAPGLFHHLGEDGGLVERVQLGLLALAADHQHVFDFNGGSGLAGNGLDEDGIILGHLVLLAARLDDREHGILAFIMP